MYENYSILNIQETKQIEMTQHNSMMEIVNGQMPITECLYRLFMGVNV